MTHNEFGARIVHDNPWFRVSAQQFESGAVFYRVLRGTSVLVVPVLDDGRIVALEGTRDTYGSGVFLELPAGGVEQGESPQEAALRELKEETGYTASRLHLLGEILESPGLSPAITVVYLAEGLKAGDQELDRDENWSVVHLQAGDLIAAAGGRMADAGSVAACLIYQERLRSLAKT